MDQKYIFCFYGFYRNGEQFNYNFNIPKYNRWFQQPYRIFSLFYNIKGVLNMLPNLDPETIIILSRIDIGLEIKCFDTMEKLLKIHDVLLGIKIDDIGTDDKWFIFKYKNVEVFKTLYDSYENYLRIHYSNNPELGSPSTRPEDIFNYHFQQNNMDTEYTFSDIILYHFVHVCSKYCGHNCENTET